MSFTDFLGGAAVILAFGLLFVWMFRRSYLRNRYLFNRTPTASLIIAVLAVVLYPFTLLHWLLGPTPERRVKRRE